MIDKLQRQEKRAFASLRLLFNRRALVQHERVMRMSTTASAPECFMDFILANRFLFLCCGRREKLVVTQKKNLTVKKFQFD